MKVKLKSEKDLRKLVRAGKIKVLSRSDSGEVTHYGTVGNPSAVITVWYDDFESEYLIVDHAKPMSKQAYEQRKIFFEDEE